MDADGIPEGNAMENTQMEKVNIALQLEGDVAAAFLKCRAEMGLHTNAPVARGFIVQKLREIGYLAKPNADTEVKSLETVKQAA
ncbi:MAG: hypothetical protein ACRD82_15535 [Blastocatellia bacterium]